MSVDGQFPRFFQQINKHGVPDRSMAFNVVVISGRLPGGRCGRDLYVLQRGLHVSFLPVLVGYYLLRKHKPNLRRPFTLPEFMKYVALALAAFYFVI